MRKYQRTLKRLFNKQNRKNFNYQSILALVTVVSFVAFIAIQLVTNAILTPLGHELQDLNTEKNLLLEENRSLQQEIANNTSVVVVQKYSQDKFGLSADNDNDKIVVQDNSILAQR